VIDRALLGACAGKADNDWHLVLLLKFTSLSECLARGVNSRHCEEPTGRANARPMTGSATTQSIVVRAWIASLCSQ
jgi:hypothetical protein